MTTTRALVMTGIERLELTDVTVDELRPTEALVEVVACGVCHSDLTTLRGQMLGGDYVPKILGHEAAGIVSRVGAAVREFVPGDHVVGCYTRYCGRCPQCLEGLTYLCANRTNVERDRPRLTLEGVEVAQMGQLGGFAEVMLVGEDTLVKVPDEMPLDRAALLSCAVMTGSGSVTNAARVRVGSTVAVFGCGGVGLSVVQAAVLSGARQVIAVDLIPEKLELARVFGATDVVNASDGDDVAEIRAHTGGLGVDYAFECIGLNSTAAHALEVVRPGHTAYLVGLPAGDAQYTIPGAAMVFGSKSLAGVLVGANNFKRDIPILADLYLRGRLKLDEMIGERIGLSDVESAIARMEGSSAARAVVTF
jgi:S-(hydroxymethyl)glutathione dehydrogenase / alcohol dehydrogenase